MISGNQPESLSPCLLQVAEVLGVAGSLSGLCRILQQAQEHPQAGLGLATEVAWLLTHVLTSEDPVNRAVAVGMLEPMLALLQAAVAHVSFLPLLD